MQDWLNHHKYVTMTLMVLTLPRVSSSSTIVPEWVLGRNCMVGSSVGSWGTLSSWFSSSSSFSVAVWEPDVLSAYVRVVHCYIYIRLSHLFPQVSYIMMQTMDPFQALQLYTCTYKSSKQLEHVKRFRKEAYIKTLIILCLPHSWSLGPEPENAYTHNTKTIHSKDHFLCCLHGFDIPLGALHEPEES